MLTAGPAAPAQDLRIEPTVERAVEASLKPASPIPTADSKAASPKAADPQAAAATGAATAAAEEAGVAPLVQAGAGAS